MAKNKEASELTEQSPESLLGAFLKTNKEDHYNFEKETAYCVSSGSLILDIHMSGGLRPGVSRFSGVASGGKTSCALSFMKNFLQIVKDGRGIYIKSEGRLSEDVKNRSGVKFVENPEDFKDGTCFVFKTNIYETAISLARELVWKNPAGKKYFFIFDSMDALIPKNDAAKSYEENARVAGASMLTTDFLRRMALAMATRSHICLLISQVRSQVKLNPYEKSDPRLTNASGGNAALHYSDWILEFAQRWDKDIIYEGDTKKRLGHFCKLKFCKSPNEQDGLEVRYPIRYGRTGGDSVWKEYEVTDILLMFEFITKEGAWFNVSEKLLEELKAANLKMNEKFHGLEKLRDYLTENIVLTDYLFKKFKNTLSSGKSQCAG